MADNMTLVHDGSLWTNSRIGNKNMKGEDYEKYFKKRHPELYKFRQFKNVSEFLKNVAYGQYFWRTGTTDGIPSGIEGPLVFRKNYRDGAYKFVQYFDPDKWNEPENVLSLEYRDCQAFLPKALFTDEEWALSFFTLMRKTYLEDPFWCFIDDSLAEIIDFDIVAKIVPGGYQGKDTLPRISANDYLKTERVKSEYRGYRKQQRRLEDVERRESGRQTPHRNLHPCKAEDR